MAEERRQKPKKPGILFVLEKKIGVKNRTEPNFITPRYPIGPILKKKIPPYRKENSAPGTEISEAQSAKFARDMRKTFEALKKKPRK